MSNKFGIHEVSWGYLNIREPPKSLSTRPVGRSPASPGWAQKAPMVGNANMIWIEANHVGKVGMSIILYVYRFAVF